MLWEKTFLSKGPLFCPTPTKLNKDQPLDDLKSFFRRLRLEDFFLEPDEEYQEERNIFRPPSNWMSPKGRDAVLET